MNDWSFSVGTRFFKEFSVDGKKLRHSIFNVWDLRREFTFVSYLWNEEQTKRLKFPLKVWSTYLVLMTFPVEPLLSVMIQPNKAEDVNKGLSSLQSCSVRSPKDSRSSR